MKKVVLFFILLVVSYSCVDKYDLVGPRSEKEGILFLNSNPQGAKIFLLGTDTKKVTPDSINRLETGDYEITLRMMNYSDTTFNVQVYSGKKTVKEILLRKILYNGQILINSQPSGAQIFFQDSATGKFTPDSMANLKPGSYFITLKHINYADTSFVVQLDTNERITKNIELRKLENNGSIFISTNPGGAQIYLDGIFSTKLTPDTLINISEGNHEIKLTKTGFVDTTFSVNIIKDELIQIQINLKQILEIGDVFINSKPSGASIILDGINTSKVTPDSLTNLSVGTHSITLTRENFRDTTFNIEIQSNTVNNYDITLIPFIESGNLFIDTTPQGAVLWLNGEQTVYTSPDTLKNLPVGNYQIKLSLNGYNDTTITTQVLTNQTSAYFVQMTQITPTGNIFVDSDPVGAGIYLNGNLTNHLTPYMLNSVLTGDNQLTLKLDGFADTTITVNVQKNRTSNIFILLKDTTSDVKVISEYNEQPNGQIVFNFKFNQSIRLDSVVIQRPGGVDPVELSYSHQLISEGIPLEIVFPNKVAGVWIFTFHGNKEKGRKAEFEVNKLVGVL